MCKPIADSFIFMGIIMGRIVFAPPIPISAIPYKKFLLQVERKSINEIRSMINLFKGMGYNIECYIRHTSTVDILNKALGLDLKPSSELYSYKDGDILVVVGLKNPVRGKEVKVSSVDDLDIAVVYVVSQG